MNKLPKFRRKPKPPALETTVQRFDPDSAPTRDAVDGDDISRPNERPVIQPAIRSTFRSFRLRGTAKRAREISPATFGGTPQRPAIVGQDGLTPQAAAAQSHESADEAVSKPAPAELPSFLAITELDIESRYRELMWSERGRIAEGMRNESAENFQWGLFKQTNTEEKGTMDRYMNVRPWNHNRVKLQVPEAELDYVNASNISMSSPSNPEQPSLRYIAMQGPTEPSFPYVWRMIAQQMTSDAVIVQLTSMFEGGAQKCHQYFPDNEEHETWPLNEGDVWGDGWAADLSFDSVEHLADDAMEKRKLLLHVKGEDHPRVVWHFLYKKWPDFGVPQLEDLDSFFELMKLSRDFGSQKDPRIIHCSAGIGRTGTFIALEHLMRELESGALEHYDTESEEEHPDLIYETVDTLRQQRRGMVQGETQYRFIYHVMKKLWDEKYGPIEDDSGAARGEPAAKRLEVGDHPLNDSPIIDLDDATPFSDR